MSVFLGVEDVSKTVVALAKELAADIDESWMVIALMDGAFVFAADLMRVLHRLGLNLEFDSLCLSSGPQQGNEQVQLLKILSRDVTDRNVLIVDDIFETGHTLHYARHHLKDAGCAQIKTCVFAAKSGKKVIGIAPDYIGWQAPDDFLVGYGLDDKGRFRGQPFISAI